MVVKASGAYSGAKPSSAPMVSPTSQIDKIASLKRYVDRDYTRSLLHDVAKAVAPIMHQYKFKVGLLCEMFPKNGNLLGLNVNGGQKIMLRLRHHHNDKSFLPFDDIIGTMLHELVHNVHGAHNASFYKLLDELREKFELNRYNHAVSEYVCEENRLGGRQGSVRDGRLAKLSKGTFKAESRKLGGVQQTHKNLRQLALEAAERRLQDSKWCHDTTEPADSELEIIDVEAMESDDPVVETLRPVVIDLTDEA